MTKSIFYSFAAASILLLACKAPKPVAPNTGNAQNASSTSSIDIKPEWLDVAKDMDNSATMQQLATGKSIYYGACTKCHGWKDAKKYDAVAWERILQSMIPKAKLTPDEAHHLRLYTIVYQKS
jgi:hypothetical protein